MKRQGADVAGPGARGARAPDGRERLVRDRDLAFALYERGVQSVEHEVRLFDRVMRDAFGKVPCRLREDFSAAGAMAACFVRSHPDRVALAVDFDEACIERGERVFRAALDPEAQRRLRFAQGDVLDVDDGGFDLISAQNFSWCGFQTRADLCGYFERCWERLGDEGVLLLDVQGGGRLCTPPTEDRRPLDDEWTLVWRHESRCAITGRARFTLGFASRDGRELRDAFVYRWRLWSLPETRDVLRDAGFDDVVVYWEKRDAAGAPRSLWARRETAPDGLAWVAYLAARKA